jgi:hypothetical protein
MEAFFSRVSETRFEPSEYTRGPWDPNSQHAGPPAALLGRAVLTRPGARDDMRLARMTFEIGRPVPLVPLTVATRVLRAGRSVELVEATLVPDGGAEVMRATAMRIRTDPASVPAVLTDATVTPPQKLDTDEFFPVPWDAGYHTGMEFRFAAGRFVEPGPATCWFRMRVPLVAGEEPLPLDRVLIAADSGNGVSGVLDIAKYAFINTDLTVHLHRYPAGEWVCLDARTSIEADGIGMAESTLHDEHGSIGRGVQSLYVAAR